MQHAKAWTLYGTACMALGLAALAPDSARAETKTDRVWTVPIVMEEATLRGKVVILETRRDDRRTIQGLRIEIWKPDEDNPKVRKTLLHKTETDDQGLFSLPLLEVGNYILIVSNMRLSFTVVPAEEPRSQQAEPKILLLLLPKDVL